MHSRKKNYVTPTPIQTQTIPIALSRRDVIGIAQTGTGKTAAFALPILHHLFTNRRRPERKTCRVLVLSPTRELSGQILDSFRTYGRHVGISAGLAIGGVLAHRCVPCSTASMCWSPRRGVSSIWSGATRSG